MTKAVCVLGAILFPALAAAQAPVTAAAPVEAEKSLESAALDNAPALPPEVTYSGGQLKIVGRDTTLALVLSKLAELTGVKIDAPASAQKQRLAIVQMGPGPARQILAKLLSDSSFDYLIQASEVDADQIKTVLLLAREKGRSGGGTEARQQHSPFVRVAQEQPPAENPVQTQADVPVAEVAAADPPPAPAEPVPPARQRVTLQDQSGPNRPGALSPPQNLTPQSINQQLEQMYQQRVQMVQQDRQLNQPGANKPAP